MIRIDLGRDESKRAAPSKLGRALFEGLQRVREPGASAFNRVGRLMGGISSMALLLVAGGAALVPHFLFEQYKAIVIERHEREMKEIQQKITIVSQEIAKLTPFQKELESYEAQKRLVRERLDVIRTLLKQRGTPVSVMDAIGQGLPQKAWLNLVDFDLKGGNPSVTLTGEAFSNEDISDYVDRLLESVHLKDVTLESVASLKSSAAAGVDVRTFKLVIVPKIAKVATPDAIDKKPASVPAKEAPKAPISGGDRVKGVEGM